MRFFFSLFQDLLRGPSRRNPLNRRLCASPKLPRCVLRESIDLVPNIRSLASGNAAEVEQTTTFFRSWRIRTACATEGYFQLQRALLERALPELPTRLGGEHRFPSINAVFASPDARLLKRFLKLLFVFFGSGRPVDGHRWRQFFSLCHTHTDSSTCECSSRGGRNVPGHSHGIIFHPPYIFFLRSRRDLNAKKSTRYYYRITFSLCFEALAFREERDGGSRLGNRRSRQSTAWKCFL